jgi:NTP pyrophosphatase (non-canonical NTP hydrolase)
MNVSDMRAIHQTAIDHEFYDAWPDPSDPTYPAAVLAKMALIHSEVSEILEAYRKQRGSEAIMTEFADTFIRMYDLIIALYYDGVLDSPHIDDVIRAKMAVNDGRPAMHGNLL